VFAAPHQTVAFLPCFPRGNRLLRARRWRSIGANSRVRKSKKYSHIILVKIGLW
jgi:hypothetical protein